MTNDSTSVIRQATPPAGLTAKVPAGSEVMLAIDIGGTKMAAGIVTMQGELIDRDKVDVDHDLNAEALFISLRDLVESQLDRARGHHRVVPVAVSK